MSEDKTVNNLNKNIDAMQENLEQLDLIAKYIVEKNFTKQILEMKKINKRLNNITKQLSKLEVNTDGL